MGRWICRELMQLTAQAVKCFERFSSVQKASFHLLMNVCSEHLSHLLRADVLYLGRRNLEAQGKIDDNNNTIVLTRSLGREGDSTVPVVLAGRLRAVSIVLRLLKDLIDII
jgi:hypothetical protein